MKSNVSNLKHCLEYLKLVFEARCKIKFSDGGSGSITVRIPPIEFFDDESSWSRFIIAHEPSFEEYVLLLLALVPHIQPDFLDKVIQKVLPSSGDFPEIGGVRDKDGRIFLPTGETALFLLAGDNLEQRFAVQKLFSADHWFAQENILTLEPAGSGQPYWSGRLLLDPEYIELFTVGRVSNPPFSSAFPAREIKTDLGWEDLILSDEVMEQIAELKQWMEHHTTLEKEWGMGGRLRPGYRVLFHGPPGTGKTLTATLLGRYTGRKVFRIDLSTVVSKYIGETEKNLAQLFDRAQNKQWILFFDEADALFGKRTDVKDAHDRYANQEVSYLLQRVEEFDGLVILASNFKANLDKAFLRRFNAIIRFPFPGREERTSIWRISFPSNVRFEDDLDLPDMLGRFELTGGHIINIVQYTCLTAIARGEATILLSDALKGIQREVEKEGKIFRNILEG